MEGKKEYILSKLFVIYIKDKTPRRTEDSFYSAYLLIYLYDTTFIIPMSPGVSIVSLEMNYPFLLW